MSEEEKEVLQIFKNGLGLSYAEEKIILNLIDRLQKELEQEKLKNEALKGTNDDLNSLYLEEKEKNKDLEDETIKDLIHKAHIIKNAKVVNANDYVSKDELQELKDRILLLLDDGKTSAVYLAGIREYFDDLLKEN